MIFPESLSSFDTFVAVPSSVSFVWKLSSVFTLVSVEVTNWSNSLDSGLDTSFSSTNSVLVSEPFILSSEHESWKELSTISSSLHCFGVLSLLFSSSNCQLGIFAELTFVERMEFDFGKDIGVIVGLSGNLELLKNKDRYWYKNIFVSILLEYMI